MAKVKPYSGVLVASGPDEEQMPQEQLPEEQINPLAALQAAAKTPQQKLLELAEQKRIQEEESKALQQELINKGRAATDMQRQGVEENELMLDKIKRGGPSGLERVAPAAARFIDTISGDTQLAKQFQAPPSEDERNKQIFMLQNALQAQKKGLSEEEINLIKTQIAGRQQGIQDRATLKRNMDIDKYIATKFDPATKDLEDVGAKFKGLENALASGDQIKINSAVSNYARLIAGEKGVLTDQDVTRSMPATFKSRMNNLANYFGTDEKPKEAPQWVINSMLEMIGQTKKYLREGYQYKLDKARGTLEALPTFAGAEGIDNLYNSNLELIGKNLPDAPVKMNRINKKPASGKPKDKVDLEIEQLEKELGH